MNTLFSLQVRFDIAVNRFWILDLRISSMESNVNDNHYMSLINERSRVASYIQWLRDLIKRDYPEAFLSLMTEFEAIHGKDPKQAREFDKDQLTLEI